MKSGLLQMSHNTCVGGKRNRKFYGMDSKSKFLTSKCQSCRKYIDGDFRVCFLLVRIYFQKRAQLSEAFLTLFSQPTFLSSPLLGTNLNQFGHLQLSGTIWGYISLTFKTQMIPVQLKGTSSPQISQLKAYFKERKSQTELCYPQLMCSA